MLLIKSLYRFLIRNRLSAVDNTIDQMAKYSTRDSIEALQVEKFNIIWKNACTNVPFYAQWRDKYDLPESISSLSELESWPVLTKSDLRNLDLFKRSDVAEPKGRILTGGSTGEPIRLPSFGDSTSGVNQMVGRRKYGIESGDRTFLLWGHEHLYGTGLKRKINAFKRRLKDWLGGWKRVSAYDLGESAMREAYGSFSKFRPKFIIGFSPAVLAFVRHNKDKAKLVDSVQVILCTAGPLSNDEKVEIEEFFGGVVCMEYGSVECGVIAYTRPRDGQYDVFWSTHLLQAQKQSDGEYKNLVTRLIDCYVPLIRYDIGDYLDLDCANEEENKRSVLEIKSVKGRPSEMINFKCGVSFFGALIGDCVKQVPDIISSQIAVDELNDRLEIRVTASRLLSNEDKELIVNRLQLTVRGIEDVSVSVEQKEKLFTTVGGKIPRIIKL